MKKLKLLFLLAILSFLAACGSEEDTATEGTNERCKINYRNNEYRGEVLLIQ